VRKPRAIKLDYPPRRVRLDWDRPKTYRPDIEIINTATGVVIERIYESEVHKLAKFFTACSKYIRSKQ
jgi:hypothetical protein